MRCQLKEQRHPTRHDLDEVSKDIPVYVIHQSGHLGAANSKALEIAGINAEARTQLVASSAEKRTARHRTAYLKKPSTTRF